MKDLILNIKHNRIPKEVLYLMKFLVDNNSYVYRQSLIIRNGITDERLFVINKDKKTILCHNHNINKLLFNIFRPVLYYCKDEYEQFIKDAINYSIFSDYKLYL